MNERGNETAGRSDGGGLHPRVYLIVIGLSAWFALAVWLFAGPGDYLLFIVNGLIFVVVALSLILAAVDRSGREPSDAPAQRAAQPPFRGWVAGSFGTWSGRLSGRQAMLQILLPFAAAAVGMTIFGVALHIAERGGA